MSMEDRKCRRKSWGKRKTAVAKVWVKPGSGKITVKEAVELIKQGSRRYAKRQLTWFKRDAEGIWLNLDETGTTEDTANECIRIIKERGMA